MKSKKVYLACNHDRHTDDEYEIFYKEEDAKNKVREWMEHWGDSAQERAQYGDWCLIVTDDYYAFVQEVKLQ